MWVVVSLIDRAIILARRCVSDSTATIDIHPCLAQLDRGEGILGDGLRKRLEADKPAWLADLPTNGESDGCFPSFENPNVKNQRPRAWHLTCCLILQ